MNNLLFNNVKFQIASLVVFLILSIAHFYRPRLRNYANKVFSGILISTLVYLLFDFLTVFSLCRYTLFSKTIIDWLHRGFIWSFALTFLLIIIYLYVVSHHYKRPRIILLLILGISFLASVIATLFLPIYYNLEDKTVFSYGPMVADVYLVTTLYTLILVFVTIKNLITEHYNRNALLLLIPILIWSIFGIVQYTHPQILASSFGLTSMLLLIYLILDNPSEFFDKETNIFNQEALKLTLQDYLNKKKPFIVINVDIPQFSFFKEQLSEEAYNSLIHQVTEKLAAKTNGKIYRLNDDSFTTIVKSGSKKDIDSFARKLRTTVSRNYKLPDNEEPVFVKGHIDIVDVPEVFDYEGQVSDLISLIEKCHQYSSNHTLQIYKITKDVLKQIKFSQAVLKTLTKAIANDEIEMLYQPIYDIAKGKFTNAEALVRLVNSTIDGQVVGPDKFIPIAEEYSLISKLGIKTYKHVFDFLKKENPMQYGLEHIELNLSAIQSVEFTFPILMRRLLQEYNIDPKMVNLEITESASVSSERLLSFTIKRLKSHGCTFSMDDFGTGYSNLSKIAKTDFDLIKIDKSLITPAFDQKIKQADRDNAKILLEYTISLIKNLKLKIVAEGVETQEEFDFLKDHNVDYIQGYFFSKPLRSTDFLEFLKKNN